MSTEEDVRIDSIAQRLARVESREEGILQSLDRLAQAVNRIEQRVNEGTNWGVLGTWGAVLITILGGIGFMAVRPLEQRMDRYATRLDNHVATTAGDSVHIQTLYSHLSKVTDSVETLDEVLQREMRLLDSAVEQKITALDTILQREIRLINDTTLAAVQRIEDKAAEARNESGEMAGRVTRHEADIAVLKSK